MARKALTVLIVSVALSAVLGIVALVSGDFGETEGKILLSTLCVAAVSILAMGSSAAWERGVGHAYAATGIFTSLFGGALVLIGIWAEVGDADYWRLIGSLVVLGTAGAHGGLLFIARLAPRYKWVRPATLWVSGFLAILILVQIWGDWHDDVSWRVLGVLAILAAAGTIVLGVFQRLSRDELADAAEPAGPSEPGAVCCPHCGEELPAEILGR